MRHNFLAWSLWLVAFVSGCGGGGGGNGAGALTGPASETTSVGAKLMPSIDQSVSETARARITNVGTLFDQKPLGQTVLSPTSAGGREVVLVATDASGDIVLASVKASADGSSVLGVDSTSLALGRLVIGSISEVSGDEINAAIEDSASFSALRLAIKVSLDIGKTPSTDTSVLQALGAVVAEAQVILRARKGLSKQKSSRKEQVTTPPPFSVLGATGPLPSVYVMGSNGAGVQVSNATPLYWSATTVGPPMLLEPSSLLTVALGNATPWLGPQTYDLVDKGGPSFDLVVAQTIASQRATLTAVFRSLFSLALDNFPAGAAAQVVCKNSLINALISSDTLDALAGNPSADAFKSYLTGTALEVRSLGDAAAKCLSASPQDFGKAAGAFVKSIAKLAVGLSQVQSGLTSLGLGFQFGELTKFWNRSFEVQVCQTKGFTSLSLVNCTARFELQGPALVAVPGATFAPTLQAYDRNNKVVGFPAASRYRSYNPTVAKVDPELGTITALVAGVAEIEVYDDSVPVNLKFSLRVVNPSISPQTEVANVGETKTFKLVDDQGSPIIVAGSETLWESSDTTIGQISPFSTLGGINVVARKPGDSTITATNPATGVSASAVLTVRTSLSTAGTLKPLWEHFSLPLTRVSADTTNCSHGPFTQALGADAIIREEATTATCVFQPVEASLKAGYTYSQFPSVRIQTNTPPLGLISEFPLNLITGSGSISVEPRVRAQHIAAELVGRQCASRGRTYDVKATPNGITFTPAGTTGASVVVDLASARMDRFGEQYFVGGQTFVRQLSFSVSGLQDGDQSIGVDVNERPGLSGNSTFEWAFSLGTRAGNSIALSFTCAGTDGPSLVRFN